ncbi:MAG: glycosyltransferase [Bacteroidales bacterium]|nr:glycosyltransferase [Clostridium sp.]MCM1204384.1 glycosyltransferase [Bacteroidales bacterium]
MYEKLIELVNQENWTLAKEEFNRQKNNQWDDTLAILAASIQWQEGEMEEFFASVTRGLQYNERNYELYLLLGNYYAAKNVNQAWLCYENAEFYCENAGDLDVILQFKRNMEQSEEWDVRKTAIVILSYNLLEQTRECVESIRRNNIKSSYEIIIVDNHSTDGSVSWLEKQEDIKVIYNSENKGFPTGCNQGIKIAEPEEDIFLLNNDTLLTPNALFWLRMGLYENQRVGATGSVSNFVGNGQRISEEFTSVQEYMAFGKKNNIPMRYPYEKKIYLVGFALLLKREALDEVGLLDLRFSPGTFEDDDMGIRLLSAGWQVLLCKNSFIFHYGSGNGKNLKKWGDLENINRKKFKDKWKFDITYYSRIRNELIGLIEKRQEEKFRVLELGCGFGATLAKIEALWPNARVQGIELQEKIVEIASNYLDILQGDIESMPFTFEHHCFDYIILGDVIEHLREPQMLLQRMIPYLKEDGHFLCSIPNVMHISVVAPLLQGKWDYQESGILDWTHLRFFTLDSMGKLFEECGLGVEKLLKVSLVDAVDEEQQRIIEEVSRITGVASKERFLTYQYIFQLRPAMQTSQ